ncbi:MAG: cytochrome c3 family protein, partial [Planctomycetes bacterium]|nr:cytochrome c3 family protein [Planctomycetota bacterium]
PRSQGARTALAAAVLAAASCAAPAALAQGRGPEAAPPPRPEQEPIQAKLPDKSLEDYGSDCRRSGCHAGLTGSPLTHGPVAVGACDACHLAEVGTGEHRFDRARPKGELCTFCHNIPSGGPRGENTGVVLNRAIAVLEPRRTSPQIVLHKPYADGECTSCHDPHGGKTGTLLVAEGVAALCDKCHEKEIVLPSGHRVSSVKDEIAAATVKHGPVEKGDCGACHLLHGAPHRHLLPKEHSSEMYVEFSERAYDFCFSCHDRRLVLEERTTSTRFRDGDRNLHHVHVNRTKGRSCGVCHATHGGRTPGLVRDTVPFGPGGWRLPIGFARSETGGSCASGCHKKLGYDNSAPAPAAHPRQP